jgi:hypothetical protein
MTLHITYIEETNEEIEEKAVTSLMENFNSLAKSKNIKYRIYLKYGYPHLGKNTFFGLFEDVSIQIIFIRGVFHFERRGIDESVLEEVKSILEEIPEIFEVEMKK